MSFSLQAAKRPGRLVSGLRFTPQTRALHQSVQDESRKRVHIRGIPTTATPSDVLRMARHLDKHGGLENITDVKLDYHRFIPSGRAFIEFKDARHAEIAVKALKSASLTALPIRATTLPINNVQSRQRLRGVRGRMEAVEREALDGNGLGAGVNPRGTDVVVWGLPGQVTAAALRLYLKKIRMVGTDPSGEPMCEVLKLDPPRKNYTLSSKYYLRLNSVTESHAFVRRMHMTYFFPEVWGTKYLIQSRVVY